MTSLSINDGIGKVIHKKIFQHKKSLSNQKNILQCSLGPAYPRLPKGLIFSRVPILCLQVAIN